MLLLRFNIVKIEKKKKKVGLGRTYFEKEGKKIDLIKSLFDHKLPVAEGPKIKKVEKERHCLVNCGKIKKRGIQRRDGEATFRN